jgi:hypothetical protein
MPLLRHKKRAAGAANVAMDARLVDALMTTQGIARMAAGAFEVEVAEVMRKLARGHRRPNLAQQEGDVER